MFKTLNILTLALVGLVLAGCDTSATVASRNLSQAAEEFQIERRIVFYDAIQGVYLLTIEGRCSIETSGATKGLEVTCKTGPNAFKKHFLGLSDNVTFVAEQLETADVSVYRYKVMFRPTTLIPDVDLAVPSIPGN